MTIRPERSLADRMTSYCRSKFATSLNDRQRADLERFLLRLVDQGAHAPARGNGIDWRAVASEANLPVETVRTLSPQIRAALDAIARAFPFGRPLKPAAAAKSPKPGAGPSRSAARCRATSASRRGRRPAPVIEFPEPVVSEWTDVPEFASALTLHMRRYGDTAWALHRAILRPGEIFDHKTIKSWMNGAREPRTAESREMLQRIEHRYRLPAGYFAEKLGHRSRATAGAPLPEIARSEQRRLAWHLPHDFRRRPAAEQAEILDWVQNVIVSGNTEYRRYQAAASRHRFALRFPPHMHGQSGRAPGKAQRRSQLDAPPRLVREMAALLEFKTAPLTALGYQRNGVWGPETASQKVEHLSLLFGALAADPDGEVQGLGIPKPGLSLGLLAFPAVWDWYLRWRHKRRGFYTAWELDMLMVAMSLVRRDSGWFARLRL